MSKMFNDLMKGLDEVEAYLNGTGVGYRVHSPEDVDVIANETETEAVMQARGRESKPRKRAQANAA